jgi:predicted neuraminidase
VVTYPAPPGEPLSTDYEVRADGKKVDVYTARVLDPPFAKRQWDFGGAYSFANFDVSGPVTVRITSPRSLRSVVVRPQSPAVKIKVEDEHTLLLTLDGPRKLSIEPDGKKGPLLLFANPIEKNPPKAKEVGVIYYGPGIHKPGLINVGDNQTLYLAGGAVVHGAVAARGKNIRICGRGILDGSEYEWRKGPHPFTIGIYGTDIELSGITVRGSSHWTIVPRNSRRVTIRNVKICNSRVQNDDGINPCNSQDVRITDCFIRSDDDCIALKGLDLKGENNNVEDIVVENCILWCDRARVFLLGHESRAEFMRRVTLRNLDILHFSMTAFLLEPGEEMRLEDIRVENVRVHGEGQGELIRLRPVVNQYMRKKVPGLIRNVCFTNLQVHGKAGRYQVRLAGADAKHDVRKVTFENVSVLDKPLLRDSPRVSIGQHVSEVQFRVAPEARFAAMSPEEIRAFENMVKEKAKTMARTEAMELIADLALIPPEINTSPLPEYGYDRLDYGMTIGIERTPGGRLWACWVAGGDSPKAFFVLAKSDDDGETWSDPRLVVDAHSKNLPRDRSVLVGNLWTDPKGRLWLVFDQSMDMFDGRGGVWVSVCENPDAGKPAWSRPRRIWHGVTLNKPTVLANGEWMLPISLDQRGGLGAFKGAFRSLNPMRGANVFVSTDQGATWQRRGCVKFPNLDWHEHMFVQRKDGSLWMLARTRNGIMESTSSDGGRTWSKPARSAIKHPVARFHIRRLASGRILLIKHGETIDRHEGRSKLTAWLSEDEGETWKGGLMLDPRTGISYPDGFQAPDGTIYISYDRNRSTDGEILLARFTEADILAGKLVGPRSKLRMLISRPLAKR